MRIRKARVQDVRPIHALLMEAAGKGELLPRPYSSLYGHLRDFYVLEDDTRGGDAAVLGCCALSVTWEDLAEIRSLAVAEAARGTGQGRALVDACLSESLTMGLTRVFTLTYLPDFFAKFGFREVDKSVLPQKVWSDCINCPKFPECDEISMLLEM